MKSVDELVKEYREMTDVKKEDYVTTKKLPDNHVEDEDKSVKWNKEFVKKNNELYVEQNKAYRSAQSDKQSRFQAELIASFADDEGLSIEEANIIFGYAWQQSHNSGYYEVMGTASEVAYVVNQIKELDKK